MKDIYMLVKDMGCNLDILSAAFSCDEAIEKAHIEPVEFEDGQMDIIEKNYYGRIAIMKVHASTYENLLKNEGIQTVFEISDKLDVVDSAEDSYAIPVTKIFNKLNSSNDKAEWEKVLGLNNVDSVDEGLGDESFDAMIINKG